MKKLSVCLIVKNPLRASHLAPTQSNENVAIGIESAPHQVSGIEEEPSRNFPDSRCYRLGRLDSNVIGTRDKP